MFPVLIVLVSLVLFVYWSQAICILILETKDVAGRSAALESRIRLQYFRVRERLDEDLVPAGMDRLQTLLDEDYALLTMLLPRTAGVEWLKQRALRLGYRLTGVRYHVLKSIAPSLAQQTLRDRVQILDFFADTVAQEATVR